MLESRSLKSINISYSLCINITYYRLGLYQQVDDIGLLRDKNGNTIFLNSLFFGAVTGAFGAFIGTPLMKVKTRLMSRSSEKIAVGTQHEHKGLINALTQIYRKNGLAGLWRGTNVMVIRNAIGSASQIASYAV